MKAEVVSREVFVFSPGPGIATHGASFYTTLKGGKLIGFHGYTSRSDTCDRGFICHSEDNGRTWSEPSEYAVDFDRPGGTYRRDRGSGGDVDPKTGRYLSIWNEGLLPTDNPMEGMKQWKLHYSVSEDGGKTELVNEQIIHQGAEYDEIHPLPGVTVGNNSAMLGDLGQRPLTRSDGVILVPISITPIGSDGQYFNPGGGLTYHDCALLMGRWKEDGRLAWTISERIIGDPDRTTRGLIEPTIAELADSSILMVMRGSNDVRPELPGYRWVTFSQDGGQTWSEAKPWTYTDGETFHSPSSMSQLLRYSDGRLFWMGNICRNNPVGNNPRYPLILGKVDPETGLLIRDSVTVIDDRRPDESEYLTLSNFYLREDRETGELLLHMTRLFAQDFRRNNKTDWTADALLYRIALAP